jgi:hypothetical protein
MNAFWRKNNLSFIECENGLYLSGESPAGGYEVIRNVVGILKL